MKNLWDFIKRTWLLFIILFVAPICVIAVFAIKEYVMHDIDLSASDWSAMLSSLFTYWGTILLGMLAFWQNDRVMHLEERNLDIRERELKENNVPNFEIEGANVFFNGEEVELDLQDMVFGYGQKKQCALDVEDEIDTVQLTVLLKNVTNISAFSVEILNSQVDFSNTDNIYPIRINEYEKIDGGELCVLYYFIRFDKIKPRNGCKMIEINFNLNYRNLYGYYFHNSIRISVGWSKDLGLVIDIVLCDQEDGTKANIEEKSVCVL